MKTTIATSATAASSTVNALQTESKHAELQATFRAARLAWDAATDAGVGSPELFSASVDALSAIRRFENVHHMPASTIASIMGR